MLNAFIVLVTVGTAALLLYPRLAQARLWRAAITPLASIIGSGFLVLGPILDTSYGKYAPSVMLALCLMAYCFGAAIRFNIARRADDTTGRNATEDSFETAASWALAFAYVISVAYYLNLLGSFAVSMTPFNTTIDAKLVTSVVFVVILIIGWTKGFHALERVEQVSVGVKLAIIAGLLFGLGWYFVKTAVAGDLIVQPPKVGGIHALTIFAGLLVTVQGFETSRYLGADYSASERIRSMKLAQWLSMAIYMFYIVLLSYSIQPDARHLSETAIIDLMAVVAPILPLLLIAAAISAQFSAAVADTGGSGGLIAELTGGRVSTRKGYAILVAIGLVLTWAASVFEIISYASRAFALYYAIQSAIAAIGAWQNADGRPRAVGFAALAVLGIAIAIFGVSAEG
ncbi:hypothetical protein SAMN05444149_104134 [Pseudosulfitobacter pseudonitzschiae]|uniref:Membrane protein n=1 Tax=Pseudosulfitobacter pseudonitzschiae TaxID=1402135 RepID=A0A073JGZ2_9RHOB|nr:hypothetical protein [Pseudosulfitobacter pseudonitzschiae]KEJ96987.1 membrane protein [Pseudosulfitobacter pseudonitzschiae]QKS07093.1 hypothetical protein HT745_00635 [Pseudosulfitobacter pseudonitzschiae]SHF48452.1 hypothetical protein SAMN05444149_104134 [Pseudosulfitobacter pseudonitzschiae]